MGELKIYLSEDLAKEFRRRSMERFGYGRGSISKAAEEAIQRWTSERALIAREYPSPRDPVNAIRGLMKDVKESAVELQHQAKNFRGR